MKADTKPKNVSSLIWFDLTLKGMFCTVEPSIDMKTYGLVDERMNKDE